MQRRAHVSDEGEHAVGHAHAGPARSTRAPAGKRQRRSRRAHRELARFELGLERRQCPTLHQVRRVERDGGPVGRIEAASFHRGANRSVAGQQQHAAGHRDEELAALEELRGRGDGADAVEIDSELRPIGVRPHGHKPDALGRLGIDGRLAVTE
eukprot:174007-Prymnesium_polylepis.2